MMNMKLLTVVTPLSIYPKQIFGILVDPWYYFTGISGNDTVNPQINFLEVLLIILYR